MLLLMACGDAGPARSGASSDTAAADSAAERGGVFFTLQDAGAVGTLGGDQWRVGTQPTYVDISPDGRYLAVTVTGENRLAIVDARNGAVVDTIPVGESPKGVRFAPWPGTVFVANEGSGTVSVVSLGTRTVQDITVGEMPHNIVLDAERDLMFVTLQGAGGLAVIDMEMMQLAETIPVPGSPHNLDLSPDGAIFYITLLDKQEVIAMDGGRQVVGRVPLGPPHYGVDVSPDGRWLYVTGMAGTKLHVIDAKQMQEVTQVEVGLGPHGVRTNAAGDEVYVSVAGTNEIVVVDAPTWQIKRRVASPGKPFWIAVK